MQIIWTERQYPIARHKRDFIEIHNSDKLLIRDKRLPPSSHFEKLSINFHPLDEVNEEMTFNDELWDQEWYLVIRLKYLFIKYNFQTI